MRAPNYDSRGDEPADFSASTMHLQMLRIADGNADVARRLHAVAWQAYGEADQPLGATEQAMMEWLASVVSDA